MLIKRKVGTFKLGDVVPLPCGDGYQHKLEGVWLAAHWSEPLRFTCKDCGAVYDLLRGYVERAKEKR